MKRVVVFLLMTICISGMLGCNHEENLPSLSSAVEENAENTESGDTTITKEWSEQDIKSMFTDAKDVNWNMIDCVLISDYAYDRVGAVLFWDNKEETTNVAFFDSDGYYQRCGAFLKTSAEPEFTYLGNGTITYNFEADNGEVHNFKLTISIDGPNVHFVAEDDVPQKQ